ncbi:MAG: XdhC/CoxI family protein [Methanomassiliicoccales archaeon]
MKHTDFAMKMGELATARKKFAVATVVKIEGSSLGKPGFKAIVTQDGGVEFGSLGGVCPESAIIEVANETMTSGRPRLVRVHLESAEDALKGMVKSRSEDEIHVETFCGGAMDIYVEPYLPPDRLVIIGQGGKDDIEDALVRLGKMLDFDVIVLDRTPVLSVEPDRIVRDIREDLSNFTFTRDDFVVVLTKGAYDIPALKALSAVKTAYVGLLASRKRAKEDFEKLESDGVDKAFLNSVHTPVGVDIGAVTPEEIAVSIMAEIISVRRKKKTST